MIKHEFAQGWCKFCGAKQHDNPLIDERTCLLRETPKSSLAPEPQRRELACEDVSAIHIGIQRLREEAEEADRIRGCVAMRGGNQIDCLQCTLPDGQAICDCVVCALKHGKSVADCLMCYRPGQSALPCPSRS